MPKLVITDNEGSRTIALDREIKAGRLADNEVQLKVPEASRHHCRFFAEGATWFVEDMGSSNGTLVNGRKVSKFELQDGDLISVGAVTMRFLETAATAEEKGLPVAGGWGDDEISLETEVFLILGASGREGEVVKIKGDKLTVGRRAKNDLVINDASVSQDHAELTKSAAGWTVRDKGSSNGTFIDGAKVDEAALSPGDVVSFGEVPATFGTGDPKEFAAPQIAVVERAQTEILQGASAFSDPTFEIHDVAERKSPLASILAILLLVGLAGGFAWLYINRGKLAGGSGENSGRVVQVAANMVPQKFSSFEPREIDLSGEDDSGWHKEDAVDTSSSGDTSDPVHTGEQAWSIARREADKPPTWVFLSGSQELDIAVSSGGTYALSAWVWADSAKAMPGIAVSWIEPLSNGDVREVSREVVPAAPPLKTWTEVSGIVEAPQGASRVRVGVVVAGTGEVVFDDIVLVAAAEPSGRGASAQNFRGWVTSGGALRIFHFTRPVSDGIGFWKPAGGGFSAPWESFVPKPAASGSAGTIRDAGADVAITLATSDHAFDAKWTLTGPAADFSFLIPLPGSAETINVTLLGNDRARRMRAAFEKQEAQGVIIGDQGDRVRLRFLDGEMKPQATVLDVVIDGARAFLKVDRGDRTTVALRCELSFDAETAEAQQRLAAAQEAANKRRFGEAMTTYEDVLARFPFDETIEKQAAAALEKLSSDGRASIRTLSARVDDAKFFRTAKIDDALLADLEADAARYTNTNLHAEVKLKLDELVAERKRSAAEKHDAEAKAAMDRATDYLEMKVGRREVAVALLEMVVTRYPGTEWAEQAQRLLDQLKSK